MKRATVLLNPAGHGEFTLYAHCPACTIAFHLPTSHRDPNEMVHI
uniref:Uncharacterized protein n=1 Tax=Anguilla anguilla TaxID=7936 RepID=A0A0E9VZI3_ANGAN